MTRATWLRLSLNRTQTKRSTAQRPKGLASNSLVGQATGHSPCEVSHALGIAHVASGVAVVELSQVTGQVLNRNVVVRSVKRPLQLREEVLNLVGALRLLRDVQTSLVIDDVVDQP
jgi:hypothetical protein